MSDARDSRAARVARVGLVAGEPARGVLAPGLYFARLSAGSWFKAAKVIVAR